MNLKIITSEKIFFISLIVVIVLYPSIMLVKIDACSHKGHVRLNNEDHFLVADQIVTDDSCSVTLQTDDGFFLAVADGMGGHRAGEVASIKVLQGLRSVPEMVPSLGLYNDFYKAMVHWVDDMHAMLIDEGNVFPHLLGMGTTLTGVYLTSSQAFLFNIGDSRTYSYVNGFLKQLTTDHSKTQLYGPGNRSVSFLTNCLGAGSMAFVDLKDISALVKPGSNLLICSDGLTDMISDEKISHLLKSGQPEALLDDALNAGGKDNITFINAQFL